MPVLGITGGIGSGKSTLTRVMVPLLEAEAFDADACAHELLAGDPEVIGKVRSYFGPDILNEEGRPDRQLLRQRVFADANARSALEGILHPAIRERWTGLAAGARPGNGWLLVDIPLLYETEAESHFDRVVVVACSPETQRQRLRVIRRLDDVMLEKIIGAQHDLRLKMGKANHVIWNDSTAACLEGQARLLAGWLCKYYG